MASNKELELAIKIAGKLDSSFGAAIKAAQSQTTGLGATVNKVAATSFKVAAAATAALGTAVAAGIGASINQAIGFESSMADVVKVVDGLKDSNGNLTQSYYDMKGELLDLTTVLPATAEELTQIAAAAGQSGIARDEIVAFTTDAAKMGIAFDTTADQAGDWMAKWRTSFSMSQDEVRDLADQINYLSNNSAANAVQISGIVTAVGPLGEVAGMSAAQIAALGDTMVGVGINEDVAATGIKKMATTMTAGAASTKEQTAVLDRLGISATDLADRMQTDAQGAILDFLGAVKQLPEAEQAAALKNYFGQEAIGAIAPLLTQTELLQEHFDMVGDSAQYAGSMEGEFESRSDTTANKIQLAKNAINKLGITVGDVFLPVVGDMAEYLANAINKLSEFTPYIQTAFDYIQANGADIASTVGAIGAAIGGVFAAGKLGGLFDFGVDTGALEGAQKTFGGVFGELFNFGTKTAGKAKTGFTGIASAFKECTDVMKLDGAGVFSLIGTLPGTLAENFKGSKAMAPAMNYIKNVQGAFGKLDIGGVAASLQTAFNNTKMGGMVSAFTGQIGTMVGTVKTSIAGALTNGIGAIKGTTVAQGITGLFGKASGAITSGVAGVMKTPFMGAFTNIFTAVSGKLPALGGLFSTALGPIASGFGTLFAGALPIIGVISGIIAVISILGDHMGDVRGLIENAFGAQGVAVFDGFMGAVQGIGDKIAAIFSPESLANARNAIQGMFGDGAANAFDGLITIMQSVMGVVQQLITFSTTYVKPIIENIFGFITGTVIPGLLNAFSTMAPFIAQAVTAIGGVLMQGAALVAQVIQAVLPIVEGVITAIMGAITVVGPAVLAVITSIANSIGGIISGIQQIFGGLITFITGVFTGNWGQAWQGIQDIFGGAFQALVSLAKAPINAVIALINGAIAGLNKLGITIPDWVPVFGGQSFKVNIPTIPMLANGGVATAATLAVIGEGRENEAVQPISQLNGMIKAYQNNAMQASGTAAGIAAANAMGGTTTTLIMPQAMLALAAAAQQRAAAEPAQAQPGGLALAETQQAPAPALQGLDLSGGVTNNNTTSNTDNSAAPVFSPQIIIQGNADKQAVEDGMASAFAQFKDMMAQYEKEKRRTSFAR